MEIRFAQAPAYSHDGRTLYFLSNITGTPQVWAQDEGTPWPRQVTFFGDRVLRVAPSPAAPRLCIAADEGGSENAQLFLADAYGLGLRRLTDDPRTMHVFGGWSPDGRRMVYSSNRRDGRHFDVYVYDLETDTHQAVWVSDDTNFAGPFSPDGKAVLISRMYSNLNHDLFLLDLATGEISLLTPHTGDAQFREPCFHPNGRWLYVVSDWQSEYGRVARLDLASRAWTWLTADDWDAECLAVSRDGAWLAYARNEDGTSRWYVHRLTDDGMTAEGGSWTAADLPPGVVLDAAWHPMAPRMALTLSSPLHATEVWEMALTGAAASGGEEEGAQHAWSARRITYASISGVPAETFVAPELVHYPSFDGLQIPAFYYRPKHPGPYPVVVFVHGGPESQSRNAFNSVIQYFVQRGFAVFVPNVRGSTGYGRTYVHLDDVRKRMDSVADLAASVDWLCAHGDARRDAIAVMGGSYGGFMVLAAVTHYPDLWAAGVDIVGIANLRTFIQNTSPYRRHLREAEYGTIEEDGEFFDTISPIHHVDKIRAPMLIIHGANDPRVPVSEAEQMVEALRARNHPVEYIRFEDEGHGVVKLANRVRAYGAIAAFLERWLVK